MTMISTDWDADNLTVELARLRDELDVLCSLRRDWPLSVREESLWARLSEREQALIVELRDMQAA